MKVTFIIGNGFDLACGLKTKYEDVYNEYCKSDLKSGTIIRFKKEILKNHEKWTDFEMEIPNYGIKLNDLKKFEECLHNFSDFLEKYLLEQEKLIDIKNRDKLGDYIRNFRNYCNEKSKNQLNPGSIFSTDDFNFLTFNYTNTLEILLKETQLINSSNVDKNVIHIHSKLNNGILLGVDNEELYKDICPKDSRKVKNLIDKYYTNQKINYKIKDAEIMLNSSQIIIIFGWSVGDSDSIWREKLKRRVEAGVQLVYIPYYNTKLDKRFKSKQLDREDESKDSIIKKLKLSPKEDIREQIHIITDSDYMSFNS